MGAPLTIAGGKVAQSWQDWASRGPVCGGLDRFAARVSLRVEIGVTQNRLIVC
jgi:hypothetical protein